MPYPLHIRRSGTIRSLRGGGHRVCAVLAAEDPEGLRVKQLLDEGASSYPTPQEWAKAAVPFLASLGARHNGKALTLPGM